MIYAENIQRSIEYATQRTKETHTRYIVLELGHVLLDCPLNRKNADEDNKIVYVTTV
jgi:hypothetical protein